MLWRRPRLSRNYWGLAGARQPQVQSVARQPQHSLGQPQEQAVQSQAPQQAAGPEVCSGVFFCFVIVFSLEV
jgi:hypothetical protein